MLSEQQLAPGGMQGVTASGGWLGQGDGCGSGRRTGTGGDPAWVNAFALSGVERPAFSQGSLGGRGGGK